MALSDRSPMLRAADRAPSARGKELMAGVLRAALLAALKDGKVEAVFGDGMQLAFWTSGSESAGCCRLFDGPYLSERFLGEGLTIMFRKEDATITGAIDHALLALSRSGRLQEIYLRYFPVNLYGG